MPTLLVYAGFFAVLVGLLAFIRPVPRLRLGTRKRGIGAMAGGVLLVLIAWSLPVREMRSAGRTRLDEILPRYQFHEHHERYINATPDQVWRALREVTASDIRFFRTLTAIRRFGRPGPQDILNAPDDLPIVDIALSTSFVLLAEEAPRELVVGTTVIAPHNATVPQTPDEFRTLVRPGFAVAAMNFRIEPHPRGGSALTTDTRVLATDPATRRSFARYWSVIYPGSALIRRQWLAAVARRAEAVPRRTPRAPRAP